MHQHPPEPVHEHEPGYGSANPFFRAGPAGCRKPLANATDLDDSDARVLDILPAIPTAPATAVEERVAFRRNTWKTAVT